MHTTNKVIVGGAIALVALAITLAIVQPSSRTPTTATGVEFSTRFQPKLSVIDGIGSTRDLTPVQLEAAKIPTPHARGPVSTERGHHAPADPKR